MGSWSNTTRKARVQPVDGGPPRRSRQRSSTTPWTSAQTGPARSVAFRGRTMAASWAGFRKGWPVGAVTVM